MATLNVTRGTTYAFGYQHQINGVNAPLTGCTLYFTVKDAEYDSTLLDSTAYIIKTLTTFTTPLTGYTNVELSDIETAYKAGTTTFLDPNISYTYDIRVKEASGKTFKRDEGKVRLDGSPTNRNIT